MTRKLCSPWNKPIICAHKTIIYASGYAKGIKKCISIKHGTYMAANVMAEYGKACSETCERSRNQFVITILTGI